MHFPSKYNLYGCFKLRSSKEAYLSLERLQKFTSRPVFKEQLKTKYESILRQYENELTTIETWFLVKIYTCYNLLFLNFFGEIIHLVKQN